MSHSTTGPKSLRYSPIAQLTLARLRDFFREPEAVFWVYGFPILLTVLLGVAFRERSVVKITVDVQEGRFANVARSALAPIQKFQVAIFDEKTSRSRLRTGKTTLVI